MKPLTDEARRHVRALHDRPPLLERVIGPDARIDVVRELAALEEPAVIPYLLGLLIERGKVGRVAAVAVGELLDALPPTELTRLEQDVRHGRAYYSLTEQDLRWYQASPSHIRRRAPSGWLRVPYFGLASFHSNGYVREAAVQALSEESAGRELPFLLLRLNDWVAPVRDAAETAVRTRLRPDYTGAFARALPLVFALERRDRHDAEDLPAAVIRLVCEEEGLTTMREALQAGPLDIRRAAHRASLEAGGEAAMLALWFAARPGSDPMISLSAAKAVRAGAVGFEEVLEGGILNRMLADPYMPVRREALLAALEHLGSGAVDLLNAAVLDPHGSVRHVARFYLERLGAAEAPVDFAPRYRTALQEAREADDATGVKAALGGLTETGDAADAALAVSSLEDWRASVRRAALYTLAGLDSDSYRGRIRAAIQDPSPRVSRVAGELYVESAAGAESESFFEGLMAEGVPHVRRHALRTLAGLSRWRALPHLLRAHADEDDAVAEAARHILRRWLDGSTSVFVDPTREELTAARHALGEVEEHISDADRRSLTNLLDRYER